jgi:hypothetical protein
MTSTQQSWTAGYAVSLDPDLPAAPCPRGDHQAVVTEGPDPDIGLTYVHTYCEACSLTLKKEY